MMIRSAAIVLFTCAAQAATLTVCSSGCDYTTLQGALDAVASGDVIELAAGQTITGGEIARPVSGVMIRSSRWRELPPVGVRITEAHAALLPILQPSNTGDPAIRIGRKRLYVASVAAASDTITFQFETSRHMPAVHQQIECGVLMTGSFSGSAMPGGMTRAQRYYVTSWDSGTRTATLSTTRGGASIDITSAPVANGGFYGQTTCHVVDQDPSDVLIQGIQCTAASGNPPACISIGDVEGMRPGDGPRRVRVQHLLQPAAPSGCGGLYNGILLWSGSGHVVRDSSIYACTSDGQENKAISIIQATKVLVENNTLTGVIPLLTGGGEYIGRFNVAGLIVRGNLSIRPGKFKYGQGTAIPSGTCYYEGGSGEFYRRTSQSPNTCANGACYVCPPGGTWGAAHTATETPYRALRNALKNGIELKECERCEVSGNQIIGGFNSHDSGQQMCINGNAIYSETIAGGSGSWVRMDDILIENNACRRTWAGILVGNTGAAYLNGGTLWLAPGARRVVIRNNTAVGLADAATTEIFNDTAATNNSFSLLTAASFRDGLVSNNTIRDSNNLGFMWVGGASPAFSGTMGKNDTTAFRDNLVSAGSSATAFVEEAPPTYTQYTTCAQWGTAFGGTLANNAIATAGATSASPLNFLGAGCGSYVSNLTISAAAPGFTSATNSRLTAASPYSASNGGATLLSTTGADLGADVDAVEQFTVPAEAGAPPLSVRVTLRPAGGITIHPMSHGSCAVAVYAAPAKLSPVASGTAVGAQTFASISGRYWWRATCGSSSATGEGAR